MKKMPQIYLLLFSLYWAQGLPVGFMTHALPIVLRAQGVSLTHIGGFGLLMAPWALKVLWAPWVDHYGHQIFGHYRSWIIPTQLLTILTLIILSFLPIESLNNPIYLLAFFIALLCMNSVGATQDIATDGLAVNILDIHNQHMGNMFQVLGSRFGFIVGGGALLWILDWLSWQSTFLILAAIVLLNTLPILFYREPKHTRQIKGNALQNNQKLGLTINAIQQYLKYFLSSKVMIYWFIVLCCIKVTDGLSGPIIKPLLVDLGLTLSQIGVYITMLGALAALLGAGVAALYLRYFSRSQALILFSVFKLISLFGFSWLAKLHTEQQPIELWVIYLINALEDMFSAMVLVIILTMVMQYSRKQFAGTDFTLQVSLMALVSGALYTVSGIAGDLIGYKNYLLMISILGIVLLMPLFLWRKVHNELV